MEGSDEMWWRKLKGHGLFKSLETIGAVFGTALTITDILVTIFL